VLAANFAAWLTYFWDREAKSFKADPADDILKNCLITHGGAVVHPQFAPKP
jgi:H+-translocating NAD(P) transhydrogenase subunit alpha